MGYKAVVITESQTERFFSILAMDHHRTWEAKSKVYMKSEEI